MSRDWYRVKRTGKKRCHFSRYDPRYQGHAFFSRDNYGLFLLRYPYLHLCLMQSDDEEP